MASPVYRFLFVLTFLLASLLDSAANAGSQQFSAQQLSEDLQQFSSTLKKKHVNLFSELDEAQFDKQVESLGRQLKGLHPGEFSIELSRILASVGDGHTMVGFNLAQAEFLPVNFKSLQDGIFIRAISTEHSRHLGSKLTQIGGLNADDVISRLAKVIPHDNQYGLRKVIDNQLNMRLLLEAIGARTDGESISLTLESEAGRTTDLKLKPATIPEFRQLRWSVASASTAFRSRKSQLNHWNDWMPDQQTLYFKFNRCRDAEALQKLVNGTAGFIQQNHVKRFVVDLRDNPGGDSRVLQPLIDYLARHPTLNHPDRLFVLVGRNTYSSAVLNAIELKQKTRATLVGEPPSGKPNHFGEVRSFQLQHTQLPIYYSTKRFVSLKDRDPDVLEVDLPVELSSDNWFGNEDPALKAVFQVNGG